MIKRILLRILLVLGIIIAVLVVNYFMFGIIATGVSEGEPIENRDPEGVALLVIDIQEGTTGSISFTESYIDQSESLIADINRLVSEAVASGWHIIWIRTEVTNPLINVLNSTLARGSLGAELDRRLDTSTGELIVKKRNDSFINTPLDSILEERGIGRLVVAGLDAEHCVLNAIEAAVNRGYGLTVFEETVIAEDDAKMAEMLEKYKAMGVEVLSLKRH